MHKAMQTDLRRAMRSNRYELAGDGRILLPAADLFIGGSALVDVNGQDACLVPNLFSTEGLIYVLNAAFKQAAQAPAFYLAPFAGDVDPDATLTAANFAARMTEFTAYNEATRPAWSVAAASGTADIGNAASPAAFTINADGSTIWGFALLTGSVKQAVTGTLASCFKLDTARDNLKAGDVVNVQYTITGTDAG